jgi:uncharacterized protein (DUF1778 family)
MTDEEYERATIERFAARAVAAERRAQKAEAEVADLRAVLNDQSTVTREDWARLIDMLDNPPAVPEWLLAAVRGKLAEHELPGGRVPAKAYGTDPGAKPPTVHGIELAVGQRWVWGDDDASPSDSTISALHPYSGPPNIETVDADGETVWWTPRQFERNHPRLRLPEELTPVEPKDPYAWAKPGAWTVHVSDSRVAHRLTERVVGSKHVWNADTVSGEQWSVGLSCRRPATPEESAKLEAEYQANLAKRGGA